MKKKKTTKRLSSSAIEALITGQYSYLAPSKLERFNLCRPKARIKNSEQLT